MCITSDTLIFTENEPVKKANAHPHFFPAGLKKIIKIETEEGFSLQTTEDHILLTEEGFKKNVSDLKKGDRIIMFNRDMNISININSITLDVRKLKEYQILLLQNKKFMAYDYVNNFLYQVKNSDFCSTIKFIYTDRIDEVFNTHLKEYYANGFLSSNAEF